MTKESILQEIHEDYINSQDYEKFLWEINNIPPSGEN